MPGPASGGGGFRGGGGGRGFGGGGGFRGGGYRGGFFYRPYGYYGYGTGCLGGFLSMLIAPIMMLLFVAVFLFVMIAGAVSNVASGGNVNYSEDKFQEFAYEEYFNQFDSSHSTFEDNILITILVNEQSDHGYCIAMTGDNISSPVKRLFSMDNGYALERAISQNMQEYYEYSFSSDLAAVIEDMTVAVVNTAKNTSIYKYPSGVDNPERPELVNYSHLNISETTVDRALSVFYEHTEIPLVIVVEDMEDVFGKYIDVGSIITVIVLLGVAAFAIYLIVRAVKERKNGKGTDNQNNGNNSGNNNGQSGTQSNSGYNRDGYNDPGYYT